MKKKLFALVLALVMVVSLVGCGSNTKNSTDKEAKSTNSSNSETPNDPSKWPVVSVQLLVGGNVKDEPVVEAALNDYLTSIDAGVLVDMVPINYGDLNTQLTLMLSDNNNPLDLYCWRFYSNLDGIVKNEQAISLDSYKDQYPEVWNMFSDKILQTQQISGSQYALPSVDSFATFDMYMLRKDIAEEIGVADMDGQRITMDELDDILLKAEIAHPEYAYMIRTENEPVQGIDSLGNDRWLGVLMNRGIDQTKIVNYYETKEFKDYIERIKKWEENGLIVDDPLNTTLDLSLYSNDVVAGSYVGGYSKEYVKALIEYLPYETVQFQLTDLIGVSSSVLGGWSISSISKNPDAAMKMLSLMYTDENVARYFILGIKDRNYVVDENGCAWYPEGVDGNNTNWNMTAPWFYPNQTLSIPFSTKMTTYYADMLEAPQKAQFSNAMGFIFDSSSVYDEVAACFTVVDQYRKALMYGQVDLDKYLVEFNRELKDAGIDKIIAAEQEQFDQFLGK
jgi:ABC-type glycerol-3-phosphate transport system substrate-binding protein